MKTNNNTKEVKLSILDKAKKAKQTILDNANKFADRILTKAINLEAQEKSWKKRKEEIKETVDKKLIDAAEKKRNNKLQKNLINSTIPKKNTSKEQSKIDEQVKDKHNTKLEAIKNKYTDWKPKQKRLTKEQRIERNKKRAVKLVHHKEITNKIEHLTSDEKIAKAQENKKIAYNNYLAEQQRIQSEKEADPKAAAERKEKRLADKKDHIQLLAEKRIKRMEKLQVVELTQKQKVIKDLEHFKLAQLASVAKKKEQQAKYFTKGGIKVPKVKKTVDVRPTEVKKVTITDFSKYIIVTSYIDKENKIIDNKPFELTCKSPDLSKRMKDYHNAEMKERSDTYVGIFAYPISEPDHCIYEMINSTYLSINGVLTSRIAKQKENKAA